MVKCSETLKCISSVHIQSNMEISISNRHSSHPMLTYHICKIWRKMRQRLWGDVHCGLTSLHKSNVIKKRNGNSVGQLTLYDIHIRMCGILTKWIDTHCLLWTGWDVKKLVKINASCHSLSVYHRIRWDGTYPGGEVQCHLQTIVHHETWWGLPNKRQCGITHKLLVLCWDGMWLSAKEAYFLLVMG